MARELRAHAYGEGFPVVDRGSSGEPRGPSSRICTCLGAYGCDMPRTSRIENCTQRRNGRYTNTPSFNSLTRLIGDPHPAHRAQGHHMHADLKVWREFPPDLVPTRCEQGRSQYQQALAAVPHGGEEKLYMLTKECAKAGHQGGASDQQSRLQMSQELRWNCHPELLGQQAAHDLTERPTLTHKPTGAEATRG